MRFDDSLVTVLSAEMSTPLGAQSAWRQLVDLIGRRRVPADSGALARLRAIRGQVPRRVRAASARAAAFADPPAALVQLFANDDPEIAAPVLQSARLGADEWVGMLPELAPADRSILRRRRDLPLEVHRALANFGSDDCADEADVSREEMASDIGQGGGGLAARILADPVGTDIAAARVPAPAVRLSAGDGPAFPIADLVERLAVYHRRRDAAPASTRPEAAPAGSDGAGEVRARSFRFETDIFGVVRWVDGAARGALIGLTIDLTGAGSAVADDCGAGIFRRRASLSCTRLIVGGRSNAAGPWRITGLPMFDRGTGKFAGYRGSACRPSTDERPGPLPAEESPSSDALRQLVHELRTPANAIGGFAEMIESQMRGPVSQAYRAHAATIRDQAHDLLAAIDDIDLAARIDAGALDLRPGEVAVEPLLRRLAKDLAPLAARRGTHIDIAAGSALAMRGDDRLVDRLVTRLATTLIASGGENERIGITATVVADAMVEIRFDRPHALFASPGDRLSSSIGDPEAVCEGAPLLGTGFALQLASDLAAELQGELVFDAETVRLRLPVAAASAAGGQFFAR